MHISKDELATKLMEQAATHIAAKEYELAINCYKHALFESPNNLKVLNVYVTFLFNLGKHRESLDVLVLNMSQFGMTNEKQNLYKNVVNAIPAEVQQHLGLKTLTDDCELALYEIKSMDSYCVEQGITTVEMDDCTTSLITETEDCPKSFSSSRLGLHKCPKVQYAVIPSLISSTSSFTQFHSAVAIRDEFTCPDRDNYKLTEYDPLLHYVPKIASLNTEIVGYKLNSTLCIEGLTLSLMHMYDRNYYHWLIELVPKLVACNYIEESITVLVRAGLPQQFYQAIELVLPDNALLKLLSHNDLIEQQRALVIMGLDSAPRKLHELSLQHITDSYQSKFGLDWLRRTSFEKLGIDSSLQNSGSRFIYLARKGMTGLRVNLADSEISQSLSLLGFESVYTEELTFEQQIKLFNSADVIVGSAGTAFANLPFCKPNTKVIILNLGEGNHVNYHGFHKLTDILELQLSYFTTQQTKVDNIPTATRAFSTHSYDSDLLVSF